MEMKTCSKCGKDKEASTDNFGRIRKKDGTFRLNARCKLCRKADANLAYKEYPEREYARTKRWKDKNKEKVASYNKKWVSNNKDKSYDIKRRWSARNQERVNALTNTSMKRYPERIKARNAVNDAIKSGNLVRPDVCSKCDSDSSRIEGHHTDYSQPLIVVWLCRQCHSKVHKDAAN